MSHEINPQHLKRIGSKTKRTVVYHVCGVCGNMITDTGLCSDLCTRDATPVSERKWPVIVRTYSVTHTLVKQEVLKP